MGTEGGTAKKKEGKRPRREGAREKEGERGVGKEE